MTIGLFSVVTNPQPLRFVSANISGPTSPAGLVVTTGTTGRKMCRIYASIGSGDLSEIVWSWYAWYISAAVGITGCNGYKIESCAFEYNGTSVPVTFAGSRSLTIGASATDIQADALLPSAFGLSSFPWGSSGYIRFMLTFANPATDVSPACGNQNNPGGDKCCYDYDPAKVIITNDVDGVGPITYTMTNGGVDNVDINNNANPMIPAMLGKFTNFRDPGVWIIPGDSAGYGTGAVASSEGARGLSWAFYPGSGIPSSPIGAIANWNLCCNSGKASDWANGTPSLLAKYFPYFNNGLDEYGGNEFNIPASQAIWASLYAAGIKYIIKTSLIPRTNDSVDFWATEGNQTIVTGWGPGSGADTFEQGLKALVTSKLAYIDHTSIRGSMHWVFVTNGVPGVLHDPTNFATADGQHPSNNGYLFKCFGAAAVTTPSGTITQSLQTLISSLS